MNAVILCGGLSTRLGEITKTVPKVLLEIKGRTVLDWQLEKLKKIGISEVVLAAGHLSEVLEKTVGMHRNGVDIVYAIEQERLGTGGAIKHAWEYVSKPEEPVIVLNGDVFTGVHLEDMARYVSPASDGMILGVRVDDASSYGTLEYDAKFHLKSFKEKEGKKEPGYINGGIYIFNTSAKQYFPHKQSFSIEYDVFPQMKNLYVFESNDPWVDIGVPDRLEWARKNWSERDV
jgi:NDP-sugar pyrophosphorylase family protein